MNLMNVFSMIIYATSIDIIFHYIFQMQFSKDVNSSGKNIRITNKSKSRSQSKNYEQVLTNQSNLKRKQQKSNLPKNFSPSRKYSKLQKSPFNHINKFSLTFSQNKNKKPLTLSVKENKVFVPKQTNQANLNKKQKVSWLKNCNQSPIIRCLMQQNFTSCGKGDQNYQKKKQENDLNLEDQLIKIDTQKYNATQTFQQSKFQYKDYDCQSIEEGRYHKFSFLNIYHQFSLQIISFKSTKTIETQTLSLKFEDKHGMDYAKIRQVKLNSFNIIQTQESKIKQILKSTVDFSKNYDELIQAINNGPTNDRQKRIFSLSKDLKDSQVKLGKAFHKVKLIHDKLEQHIENNVQKINRRKATLFASIQNLVFSTLLQSRKQRISQRPNICERILQRVHNQLKNLKDLIIRECTYNTKTFYKFNNQIQQVRRTFNDYTNIHLQNRVLQYTLIKQIEKIPALMITVFGENKQLQECQTKQGKMQFEDRFKNYMTVKCEECYHMRRKVSFLQFQNQKIKPVFKSLEWLIRDCSKNPNCLSIL